jgi:hypothetical protein
LYHHVPACLNHTIASSFSRLQMEERQSRVMSTEAGEVRPWLIALRLRKNSRPMPRVVPRRTRRTIIDSFTVSTSSLCCLAFVFCLLHCDSVRPPSCPCSCQTAMSRCWNTQRHRSNYVSASQYCVSNYMQHTDSSDAGQIVHVAERPKQNDFESRELSIREWRAPRISKERAESEMDRRGR